MKIKPRKLWGYYSPVFNAMGTYFSTDPKAVRHYCIKVGTVYGGGLVSENWAMCKAEGYRVIPVTVTVRKT
jgi:hypothetical protein